MKNIVEKMAMMYLATGILMSNVDNYQKADKTKEETPPEDPVQTNLMQLKKYQKRKTIQGLKEFKIDGIEVWALNEKNAMRKIDKIKQELGIS